MCGGWQSNSISALSLSLSLARARVSRFAVQVRGRCTERACTGRLVGLPSNAFSWIFPVYLLTRVPRRRKGDVRTDGRTDARTHVSTDARQHELECGLTKSASCMDCVYKQGFDIAVSTYLAAAADSAVPLSAWNPQTGASLAVVKGPVPTVNPMLLCPPVLNITMSVCAAGGGSILLCARTLLHHWSH